MTRDEAIEHAKALANENGICYGVWKLREDYYEVEPFFTGDRTRPFFYATVYPSGEAVYFQTQ